MLRAKLLAATAVATLIAAPAFAQEAAQPAPTEAAAATQAAEAAATPAAEGTVVDVLKSSGQFTTLLSALDQAQLTDTLQSRPAISIFAPTDAAFAAMPEAERTRLLDPANANELRQVLLYHVIVADVSPDQIEGKKGGVPTASEAQILLDGTGSAIKADNATVVSAELDASNGAVFPIDTVLNPANSMAAMGDEEAVPAADAAPAEAAPAATEATDPSATPPVESPDPATEQTDPTPQ
nr:fasciclin domain-containing protein [uncultured Brevundimonas sp.]